MKKGITTCKYCNKEFPTIDKKVLKSKAICPSCYEIYSKEVNDYKELINSICLYFNIEKPTGLIIKQIKSFKDDNGYTYKNMSNTLWYVTVIMEKQLELKYGVAIIKYNYEKAQEYIKQQQYLSEKAKELKNYIPKIKKVKFTQRKNNVKDKLLIDINRFLNK